MQQSTRQSEPYRWELWLERAVLALGRTPWGRSGYGQARGLLRIFPWIDRLLRRGHDIRPLRTGGIIHYEVTRYRGRPLFPAGQAPVRSGELVVQLHWDNQVMAAMEAANSSVQGLTWQLARAGIADLRRLASLVESGAFPAATRAIWAETIHYRALPRYGFTTRPAARGLRAPFARLFMLCVLAIYSRPGQLEDSRVLAHLELGEGWMSFEDLRARYSPAERRRAIEVAMLIDE